MFLQLFNPRAILLSTQHCLVCKQMGGFQRVGVYSVGVLHNIDSSTNKGSRQKKLTFLADISAKAIISLPEFLNGHNAEQKCKFFSSYKNTEKRTEL